MNALFMIYPVLLIILTFWGADFSGLIRPSKCDNAFAAHEDFFAQSKMIKAAACLFIILHHLTQRTTVYGNIDKGPINIFNDMGYMFTAIFFFFSGFGLITSLYSKRDYLDDFLIKRLPTVLLPFWLINIIYLLLNRFVYGKREGVIEILKDLFSLQLINGNGWFIIEITLIYLMFFVLFRLIKSRNAALTILCIAVLVIIPFVLTQGHKADGAKEAWFQGEWWANSTLSFILGMLYARFKNSWDAFFKKHYYPKLVITAVIAVLMHIVATVINRSMGYYHAGRPTAVRDAVVTVIVQNIDACIFVMLILLLSMKISLGNRFIRYISGVSLELFLIHGAFVELIFFKFDTDNDVLRFAIVYVLSIAATVLLAPIIKFVVKRAISFLHYLTDNERNRKKVGLGLIAFLLAAAAIIGGFLYGERFFFAEQTYQEEMKMLRNAGVGTHVQFGRYDTNPLIPGAERITWIVVAKKDGVATLLSQDGIDGSYYNQHHEEVSWENCDLRTHINSGDYLKMFNKFEKERLDPISTDIFTLLTVEEAETFFKDDKERELIITSVAKNRGTNINTLTKFNSWDMKEYRTSWWWLRGADGQKSLTAPIVTDDGTIEPDKKYVNKPSGAIRPVIHVRYGI